MWITWRSAAWATPLGAEKHGGVSEPIRHVRTAEASPRMSTECGKLHRGFFVDDLRGSPGHFYPPTHPSEDMTISVLIYWRGA